MPNRTQRVSDMPAQASRGQAKGVDPDTPAERSHVEVLDVDGAVIGQVTDAAVPLAEDTPRVVVGLREDVRKELGLKTRAVDIESRFLTRRDDRTAQLTEPLQHILRQEGFEV
ncbi:MAG: hypothetical protein LC624_06550 [Halobacteriales archaeon]|nr:hypothetical protein [Halobacteriales archaeon]